MPMKCPKCQNETVVVGAFNICPEHGPVKNSPTPVTERAAPDQDALKTAILRLPTVLAMPISEYIEETNPVLRLWHICEITELGLRMLLIIGIAEHGKSLPDALLRELSDRIERPTMGSWLGMAQAVANHLPVTTLNPELRETVEKLAVLIGNQASSPDSGCLSLRNLLAHGGGMRKSVAENYLAEWSPRFIEIINALSWLSDCCIAGRDRQGQLHILKGPDPQDHTDDASLMAIPTGGQPDQLLLIRGGRNLILWPLGRYATTGTSDQGGDKQDKCPQLYIRRGEVRLQYLNFGGDGAVSDSDASALDTFLELFTVKAQAPSTTEYSVPGFDGEFSKEASRRIGRECELEMLGMAIHEMRGGLLWLGGVAGMGKSCLIASAVVEIQAQPPEGAVVLAYRFRASDNRCFRETFLRFAIERLEPWDGLVPREKDLPETTSPIDRLKDCLARVQSGRRTLFVLDGLDEIVERDANFVREVILPLASDHAGFICVGRPERGIPEVFRQAGAREPFPEGLPPMAQDDVRAMLVARTEGPLRKRLIKRDKEAGDRIINPFIERVTKLSEGLPLYVNYVIGDVLAGKIAPEAEGQLPAGLHAYHEELLRRCAIGDLQAVVTPMVAMLAVAYEPLTAEVVAALLVRRGVMRDPDVQLVGRGLVALASMIRRAPNADGEDGYTLYHASLREHILASEGMRHTVGATQTALADAALKPSGDAADKYLYRHGITHLQETNRHDEALRVLTNFDYLMARLRALSDPEGISGLLADWETNAKGVLDASQRLWEAKECLPEPLTRVRHSFGIGLPVRQ